VLLAAGRVAEAAELVDVALLGGLLSGTAGAHVRLKVASALVMNGSAAEALGHAEAVLTQSGLDDEVYSSAQLTRLMALMAHDEFASTRAPAVALLAGTTSLEDDASMAAALTTMGSVAWTEGRVADSIMLLRAAVTRSRRGRFADQAMHPRQSLTVPLVALGEFAEAEALLLEDQEDIRAGDDPAWAIGVAVRRSRLRFAAGHLAEAVAEAQLGLTLADELGARLFVPVARAILATAAIHRGDLDAAAAELERWHDEPHVARARYAFSVGAWIQARISYERDGAVVAVKALAPVFDNLPANWRVLLEEPALAAWMVRSMLAAGDRTRAETVVDAAEQLSANNTGFPSIAATALHARGLLDNDQVALVRASSDHAHPWARASATEDAGTDLAAEGQVPPASRVFDSAIALYQRAGAEHDVERVWRRWQQLRVRASGPAAPDPASGWSRLTDTERRLSSLVALGLTNAQIAQRLYLSRYTVDFHLRKIFRKLNVSTRVEVTRLAVEHRPSQDDT
jgi:DNA-binding CsgD family transcriptional regulator